MSTNRVTGACLEQVPQPSRDGPGYLERDPVQREHTHLRLQPDARRQLHLHAAGHAWENYIRQGAIPQLKPARRALI